MALDKAESGEVDAVRNHHSTPIVSLKNKAAKIGNDEQREFAEALKKAQDSHQLNFLSRFPISSANISGIGEKLTGRLLRAGIRTAAEAEYWPVHRVDGFGDQKTASIKRWRDNLISQAKASAPTRLDAAREQQIRARYSNELSQVQQQLRSLEVARDHSIDQIRNKYKGLKDKFNEQLSNSTRKIQSGIAQENLSCSNFKRKAVEDFGNYQLKIHAEQTELNVSMNEKRAAVSNLDFRRSLQTRRLKAYNSVTLRNWLRYQFHG